MLIRKLYNTRKIWINKTTDPTLAKSIIDQATQAVTDAKNNLHGDQKLDQDKQRATETLNDCLT
ncbi:hypothetical protein UM590_03400 [Staphylococcus aureus]|nr:hypothetical protein UM590_03400 [Staphylococcus aureus]